ncbi:uncharacterized protein FFB20_14967 [Fusarium fujikuroi]|nr:uncharacterized protein LW93_8696 [Fusarium fujikuroi]KLP03285.1 uncharacterized protein Y057_1765 [Fusarium fujikuroi]SCN90612.1 uncharacterized protein FFC1_06072 [Fusarium fujikuroi]SCO00973.1 uncharacterized protein FFE2_09634 [Fusarium fujikuroi]SCO16312.1 uncharacterized protein FFB20_14967 [Fusarium fujikuroi]
MASTTLVLGETVVLLTTVLTLFNTTLSTIIREDIDTAPAGSLTISNVILETITQTVPTSTSTGSSETTQASQDVTLSSASSTGLNDEKPTGKEDQSGRSPDGLKGGPVAGVAIGCLVAGLALGLIAAFLLFRRRRRGKPANEGFVLADQKYTEPKDGTQVIVSSSRHDAELSQFLLEATPDKDLQAELRSLSELIYQHVENYYRRPQVQADPAEVAQSLTNIGYSPEASGLQADTVAAICLSPKTSQVGLRHVLSHVIFRSLDFNSGSSLSMLPLEVATLTQRSHSAENANNPAITLARSRWRTLSALLLHPNPDERTPLPVSVTEASPMALSLSNELNQFLGVFVTQDTASLQDQMNHLQAVILECTKLGYVVLSQPSDLGFVFSNSASITKSCRIVVCPGLERLSQNDGTRYRSPKEIVAPETVSL